ncbi:peptidyl-prolyl cis-trans isomerase protein, putative [Theileria equi strain WA]|uniref:Peptidyl-prolyl cis-trans isomerase n=1 Tax=Theileria equi strain WA TaxID=1537102 RepID=L0AZW2_THEEQ|nr:peptidyl-prolyl cis-trans isomerase protein, putative [Theileria equi strain WA]AFZ80404.1 peptidyl-prolyl cis-trans isomerase protein, putative [Theileria equi strain WA]|eukprot:XP_004830070.1 peptidyl-prolyl cis-trans isomerase protein, putative [Theileria equi strain WA]
MLKTLLLPWRVLQFGLKRLSAAPVSVKTAVVFGGVGLIALPKMKYDSAERSQKMYQDAITDYVYMDVAIGKRYAGRILIGLYGGILPLTTENFIQMCKGHKIGDKVIGYRNTKIDRIIPRCCIVAGKLFHDNNIINSCTIYSKRMPEELLNTPFVQEGDVALLSDGPYGLTSRFLITLNPHSMVGQKCVVLGTVVKGMNLVRAIGKEEHSKGIPSREIRIIDCGVYKDAEDGPKSYFNEHDFGKR